MSLQLTNGNALVIQEIKQNPYNLMATYIADYDDCLLLLLNGDKKDYEQRKGHMDVRLDILDRGPKNNPWYRLCKAGLYIRWSMVSIRMGENFKAAGYFRKSYLLLKENRKQFPQFEYNNAFWGLEQAIVGTIPDEYKWIASVFGLKGNIKKGVNYISDFIGGHSSNDPMQMEAVLYYCYLKFYFQYQQQDVWNFMNSTNFHVDDNLLYRLIKASIGRNYRKADEGIQLLKAAEQSPLYAQFPIMDYEMGCALLNKLDPSCTFYFQRFLSKYKGGLYVKDAWQKLALAYYLQGNMQRASECRKNIGQNGNTMFDADRQSARFSKSKEWPNKLLLQARLLTDGGYYLKALSKINAGSATEFNSEAEKLEYYFRSGRIYDELGSTDKALQLYQAAVNAGKDRQEYFGARAALQMGFIYERKGLTNEAIQKYEECLTMKGHDFKNAIDQQAKAGINRLTAD